MFLTLPGIAQKNIFKLFKWKFYIIILMNLSRSFFLPLNINFNSATPL